MARKHSKLRVVGEKMQMLGSRSGGKSGGNSGGDSSSHGSASRPAEAAVASEQGGFSEPPADDVPF